MVINIGMYWFQSIAFIKVHWENIEKTLKKKLISNATEKYSKHENNRVDLTRIRSICLKKIVQFDVAVLNMKKKTNNICLVRISGISDEH